MKKLPLSWAIARGRDALESTSTFRDKQEIEQDKEAAEVLNSWLLHEDERQKTRKKNKKLAEKESK